MSKSLTTLLMGVAGEGVEVGTIIELCVSHLPRAGMKALACIIYGRKDLFWLPASQASSMSPETSWQKGAVEGSRSPHGNQEVERKREELLFRGPLPPHLTVLQLAISQGTDLLTGCHPHEPIPCQNSSYLGTCGLRVLCLIQILTNRKTSYLPKLKS